MSATETRAHIVKIADDLFYRNGFNHTSFADVSKLAGLSRGNFYYHFRTKDDLLSAVLEKRKADKIALIKDWEALPASPAERIKQYIRIVITNADLIRIYGCPIGTMMNELSKTDHAAQSLAVESFNVFRDWLVAQFEALGEDVDTSVHHAMHILMASQGMATMLSAYGDLNYIQREVDALCVWVEELAVTSQQRAGE